MRRSEDRGQVVVETSLSINEAIEVMNSVHHTRTFGKPAQASSAILESGFQELVTATARAVLAHPDALRESRQIRSLTRPSNEEAEEALKILERSVDNAKKRPPVEEPKDDAERLYRQEAWERMATLPLTLVVEEIKRLRSEGLDEDGDAPGSGEAR